MVVFSGQVLISIDLKQAVLILYEPSPDQGFFLLNGSFPLLQLIVREGQALRFCTDCCVIFFCKSSVFSFAPN